MITKINIYRSGNDWAYAAWDGTEFDHSDMLDCDDDSEASALAEASRQFPDAHVARVADIADPTSGLAH